MPLSPYTRAPPSSKWEMTCSRPRASLHLQCSSPEAAEETYVILHSVCAPVTAISARNPPILPLKRLLENAVRIRADHLTDEVKVDRRNLLSSCFQDICMFFFLSLLYTLKEEFMVLSLSSGNLITQINVLKSAVELHIFFFFIPPYNPSCSFNCIFAAGHAIKYKLKWPHIIVG